jgi:uncharacterized protein (TIRG00374 family)
VSGQASGQSASPPTRSFRKGSRALLLGKLALAAAVLWLLVHLDLLDTAPLRALLDSWWLVAGACLLLWPTWALVAWRWFLLLRAQQIQSSYREVFRIAYGAAFIGLYLPGTVGVDIARVTFGLSLPQSKISTLTLSVIADRVVGLLALMLLGFVASGVYLTYLDPGSEGYDAIRRFVLTLGALFGGATLALVTAAALARRLQAHATAAGWHSRNHLLRAAGQAVDAARLYGDKPGTLLATMLISVLVHSLAFAVLALLAWKSGVGDTGFWKYAIAGAIAAIVNALSITPGGIGVGELAFAQILLWLEPAAKPVPYATVFLAHRVLIALTLLPALATMPNPFRRHSPS